MSSRAWFRIAAGFLLLCAFAAQARVVRVEIVSRGDVLNGKSFGASGAYEKIIGRVYFAVDPSNPHNRVIVDLDKAPHNDRGEVEFSADLHILRPKSRGNDTLLVEIANRGGKSLVRALDPTKEPDFGDAFLLRRGYTMAWIGWQFDVRDEPNRVRLYAPVARGVRGRVRADFIVSEPMPEHPLGHVIAGAIGGKGYPVANLNDRANVLTERDAPTAPRRVIPRKKWRFPNPTTIHLDGGFVPGKIYEVIYTAVDPTIVGTGLAAVRDFVSYAKHDPDAVAAARVACGFGISQSGRFLRHFVYQGFNADEEARPVFDGLLVHVAGAGRGSFNHRFAQPSRDAQPLSPLFYPTDVFPFADLPTTDPVSGVTAGLLDRAVAENVVPKIFYTNTSYEYWSRGESLAHTTPDGQRDLSIPPTSRIYFIAGLGHVAGSFPATRTVGQQLTNPNNYWPVTHALIDAMDAWVKLGTEPPQSRYPRIGEGNLIPVSELVVKRIGSADLPSAAYEPYKVDFGPEWPRGVVSEPPRVLGTYRTLVPQVDNDGNEIAGVRMPFVAVPLATFTGWNPRDPKSGFGDARASFIGSYIPFSKTQNFARYHNRNEYLGRFAAATMKLIDERLLEAEELDMLLSNGLERWDTEMSK